MSLPPEIIPEIILRKLEAEQTAREAQDEERLRQQDVDDLRKTAEVLLQDTAWREGSGGLLGLVLKERTRETKEQLAVVPDHEPFEVYITQREERFIGGFRGSSLTIGVRGIEERLVARGGDADILVPHTENSPFGPRNIDKFLRSATLQDVSDYRGLLYAVMRQRSRVAGSPPQATS